MSISRLVTALAVTALILGPARLAAQQSDPTGVHLAGALSGAGIVYEGDDEAESGGGASLRLGWGFNRTVTVFAEAAGARVEMIDFSDTYALAHFDLGVRLNFRGPQAKALPYAVLAVSGRSAGIDLGGDVLTITGAGPTFGGGVAIFFNENVALDLGLKWTTGEFTEAEFMGDKDTIDISATSARFDVGVSWWAGR